MKNTHESQNPGFPTQQEVSAVYTEVLEHNRVNTGFGAMLGTILGAVIEEEEISPSGHSEVVSDDVHSVIDQRLEERKQETDLQGDLINLTSDTTMVAIGLRLESTGMHVSGKDKAVSSRELEPHIDSPERFSEFLGTLKGEHVKEDESFRKLASDSIGNIVKKVQAIYTPEPGKLLLGEQQNAELEKLGEEQLRAFSIVSGSYESLGLNDTPDFQRMSEYTKRWGEGVLPDYLVAESRAYLQPDVQGWGPASWQKDINPEKLAERWDEAMDFVRYLRQDSKKTTFAEEVFHTLDESLEQALSWMVSPEKDSGYSEEYIKPVAAELDKVAARFEKLRR